MSLKSSIKQLLILPVLIVLFTVFCVSASAEKVSSGVDGFPEGVIVLPKGTDYYVNNDGTVVTIPNCPAELSEGDTFVVYLQDFPMGYFAESVSVSDHGTVIQVSKADASIYANQNLKGQIELTEDSFVLDSEDGIFASSVDSGEEEKTVPEWHYNTAQKSLETTCSLAGDAGKITISLINLSVVHDFTDDTIELALVGDWKIDLDVHTRRPLQANITLGSNPGAPKIGKKIGVLLNLSGEFEHSSMFSGSFKAGARKEGDGDWFGISSVTPGECTVSAKSDLKMSLKLFAGIDLMLAAADIYTEIGVHPEFQTAEYVSPLTNKVTICDDFCLFLFANIGAEGTYWKPFAGVQGEIDSDGSLGFDGLSMGIQVPFALAELHAQMPVSPMAHLHFENNEQVRHCTHGMKTRTPGLGDGMERNFRVFFDVFGIKYDRTWELLNPVYLTHDLEVYHSYTISNNADLHLNGHTLIIHGDLIVDDPSLDENVDVLVPGDLDVGYGTLIVDGDLIQKSGRLVVGNGTVKIHGNYYMRGDALLEDPEKYADSKGSFYLSGYNGAKVFVGKDLYIQTAAGHTIRSSTEITVGGNIVIANPQEGTSHFTPYGDTRVILSGDAPHKIVMEDIENNNLAILELGHDTTVESGLHVYRLRMNGLHMTVDGDLIVDKSFALQSITAAIHPEGGKLTVNGDFYTAKSSEWLEGVNYHLQGATMEVAGNFNQNAGILYVEGGKLHIGGDYSLYRQNWQEDFKASFIPMDEIGLQMTNPEDEIRVDGNVTVVSHSLSNSLEDGTMYIGGNFFQQAAVYKNNFDSQKNHTVIFNGSGRQIIQFGTASFGFGKVRFLNPDIELVGPYLRGFVLQDDIDLTLTLDENNLLVIGGVMDLNGHSIGDGIWPGDLHLMDAGMPTVKGKLILKGQNLDIQGDLILETGIALEGQKLTVSGDMTAYGQVDQQAGTVQVQGNLTHHQNKWSLQKGTLSVGGDFLLQEVSANYRPVFMMTEPEDVVRVGSFTTAGNQAGGFTNGTMYISGDFRQIGEKAYNFNATGNHRVVFMGKETQSIRFDSNYSGFANVTFQNPSIRLWGEYLRGFILQDDINLLLDTDKLDLLHTMDLNGHSIGDGVHQGNLTLSGGALKLTGQNVKVEGSLTSATELLLGGGQLTTTGTLTTTRSISAGGGSITVNGDLKQYNGAISLQNGKLSVSKDYYIVGSDSDLTAGSYTTTSATLSMNSQEDEVRISGSFVTASSQGTVYNEYSDGTMYIGGDFTQIGSATGNFSSKRNHKVIFNGIEPQCISFENTSCGFTNVQFVNPNITLKGTKLRGFVLQDDINLTLATNSLTLSGTMDLNGHSIGDGEHDGNLKISGGTLILGDTDLQINGVLTSSTALQLKGRKISTCGSFLTSANVNLGGGELDIGGRICQSAGTINVSGGKIYTGSDYFIADVPDDFDVEKDEFVNSKGVLVMTNPKDEVHVYGSFVTASTVGNPSAGISNLLTDGTMFISCDFFQLIGNEKNFVSTKNHKVVLCGKEPQTIRFASEKSGFNTLELNRLREDNFFESDDCWKTLIEPELPAMILPAFLTDVQAETFLGANQLQYVRIPDGLTKIESKAFSDCTGLRRIFIPVSVTEIAEDAFLGVPKLLILCADGSYAQTYAEEHNIPYRIA